jgi:hypothetical protein
MMPCTFISSCVQPGSSYAAPQATTVVLPAASHTVQEGVTPASACAQLPQDSRTCCTASTIAASQPTFTTEATAASSGPEVAAMLSFYVATAASSMPSISAFCTAASQRDQSSSAFDCTLGSQHTLPLLPQHASATWPLTPTVLQPPFHRSDELLHEGELGRGQQGASASANYTDDIMANREVFTFSCHFAIVLQCMNPWPSTQSYCAN